MPQKKHLILLYKTFNRPEAGDFWGNTFGMQQNCSCWSAAVGNYLAYQDLRKKNIKSRRLYWLPTILAILLTYGTQWVSHVLYDTNPF